MVVVAYTRGMNAIMSEMSNLSAVVWVVVSAIVFLTEIAMLKCMNMSSVDTSSWLELVELVGTPDSGISKKLLEEWIGYWQSRRLWWWLLRIESATSCIQRIPSPSPSKAAPKLKYSHVVGSTPQPYDPGKLSPNLSCVQSHDILTTLGSCDIQARDPGKVSHDLPRDWSSMRSQVATWSPDQARFRCIPSLLIGTWKTMGMINESTNQWTSYKTLERSKVTHLLPVFVPALKYGPPIWVCMPALNMYAQTTLY